jgi:hypothetical protein
VEAAMEERRRLPRKYLIIYSRVFEQSLGKLLGYLSDLSEHGAMIIADEPLEVNAILPLRLDLPDPKIFHAHHLMISARVAHCETDISPAFYDIGLEFLNVSPEQKIILQKMMEVYEFHRANGRHKPIP